jgi:hypothetical protein
MFSQRSNLRWIFQATVILLISAIGGWVFKASAQPEDVDRTIPPAAPIGTAFTYQGYLKDGGEPANGTYDFRFLLFDAPGGSQVGPMVSADDVPVTEGIFTVQLDFGDVFDGTSLWMEIEVQGPGGGGYTTLSPRQPLTAVPYASYAANIPVHDHLGELWSGVDGLEIDVSGGEGLILTSQDVGISAVTSHSLKPAATFVNTGGGLLLALNDENSPTGLEMEVTSSGDMSLSGSLTANALAGEGSGVTNVDAQTLDGVDSTGFAADPHTHPEYASNDHEHAGGALNLSVSAFKEGDGDDSTSLYKWNQLFDYIYLVDTLSTSPPFQGGFNAPVNLPQGAVIDSITAYAYDEDEVYDMEVVMSCRRGEIGSTSFESIVSAFPLSTSGSSPDIQSESRSTILHPVIDNNTYYYWCSAGVGMGATGNSLRFYGARIEYTMP